MGATTSSLLEADIERANELARSFPLHGSSRLEFTAVHKRGLCLSTCYVGAAVADRLGLCSVQVSEASGGKEAQPLQAKEAKLRQFYGVILPLLEAAARTPKGGKRRAIKGKGKGKETKGAGEGGYGAGPGPSSSGGGWDPSGSEGSEGSDGSEGHGSVAEAGHEEVYVQWDEEECIVCMTSPNDVALPCAHSFCLDCLIDWIESAEADPSCPTCRAPLGHLCEDDLWDLVVDGSEARRQVPPGLDVWGGQLLAFLSRLPPAPRAAPRPPPPADPKEGARAGGWGWGWGWGGRKGRERDGEKSSSSEPLLPPSPGGETDVEEEEEEDS